MDIEQFPLGAKVYASRSCGVCQSGERGVVVEEYWLGSRAGRTILFERGGYDGFSPEDLELFVVAEGSIANDLAGYRFEGVHRLLNDLRRGLFQSAFDTEPYPRWLARHELGELQGLTPHAPSKPGARP